MLELDYVWAPSCSSPTTETIERLRNLSSGVFVMFEAAALRWTHVDAMQTQVIAECLSAVLSLAAMLCGRRTSM